MKSVYRFRGELGYEDNIAEVKQYMRLNELKLLNKQIGLIRSLLNGRNNSLSEIAIASQFFEQGYLAAHMEIEESAL